MEGEFKPITHTIDNLELGNIRPLEEPASLVSENVVPQQTAENNPVKPFIPNDDKVVPSVIATPENYENVTTEFPTPRDDYNDIELPRNR